VELDNVFYKNNTDYDLIILDIDMPNLHERRAFRGYLQNAAYTNEVVIGVTETKQGFKLGFEDEAAHQAVMKAVKPALQEYHERMDKRADAAIDRYGLGAETLEIGAPGES